MFLKLFESVKITKGINRSIIFDSNNGFFQLIPNAFFDLLSNEQQNYSFLKKQLDEDSLEALEEYISFILNNNLGFIVKSKKELLSFQSVSNFNENPSNVEYLILDINSPDVLNEVLIEQVCNLKIKYLQLRFSEAQHFDEIIKVLLRLHLFNDSSINEISIIVTYSPHLLSFITQSHNKISNKFLNFILHTSQTEDFQTFGSTNLTIIKRKIQIPISCGFIDLKNINLNRSFYLEAKNHNSCLHKKIAIDKDGNIKNCPSMAQSFGNISTTTLEKALNDAEFKKYWNITKDEIAICKDCEFRYICTDCRAYTERTHINNNGLDISKPLKCGYNPYTGEWEEWSQNPLKYKAIQYYGMQDLIVKN